MGCAVDGCERPLHGRTWCQAHYRRNRLYGDPMKVAPKVERVRCQCSVPGCDRMAGSARGLCSSHYYRFMRYGDPLMGRARNGATADFLRHLVVNGSARADCILWPFSRTRDGYGKAYWNGRHVNAHRVACELMHGHPPDVSYEAAHTCGNGHLGCVNPLHVRWTTPKENAADKANHGRPQRRAAHPRAKLSEDQVARIRMETSVSLRRFADEFGVSPTTIQAVRVGRNWRN